MARRVRVRRLGGRGLGSIITAALATIVGALVAPRFLPPAWAIAGALLIGGAATYVLDGRTTGSAIIGAGLGMAAVPLVAGVLAGGGAQRAANVWGGP